MTETGVSAPGVLGAMAEEGTVKVAKSLLLLKVLYFLPMLLLLADVDCCADSSKVTVWVESRLARRGGTGGGADALAREDFSAEVEAAEIETKVAEIAAGEEGSGAVEDVTGN